MPYIGKQLVRGQNRKLDDISSGFNGSQTTFTLQVASQNVTVGSALQLWISLGGVIQDPLSDYTIAGNQITFTTAPAASLDFFGVIQGDVTDTNTPGDATVTTSKLASGLTVNLANGSAATSSLQLGGTDSGLFSSAADKVNVTTGGVERLEIGDSEVVFNDPSNDVDFRVESNGNANMLFVDGGNDRVGIGTGSPSAPFHLNAGTTNNALFVDSSDAEVSIGLAASDGSIRLLQSSAGLVVRTNGNANAFGTGDSEALRIDSSGRLLVGTSSATLDSSQALLQVSHSSGPLFVLGRDDTTVSSGNLIGDLKWYSNAGSANEEVARIRVDADGDQGSGDKPGRIEFHTTANGASSPTERWRINENGTFTNKTSNIGSVTGAGVTLESGGTSIFARSSANPVFINRITNDGNLVQFYGDNTLEGNIAINGTTVSYNGAHLSRWSQLASGAERVEILRGSVLSNLDEMCVWGEEDNEQLNRMKVSDVEGDPNVAGVFQAWDDDDDTYTNDFYCAMTGDFVIRIAQGTTVARGDLLMSAGDGTAKPQDDDIVRSKTIAKVTSTTVSTTYADGSYCVPCVLMAC